MDTQRVDLLHHISRQAGACLHRYFHSDVGSRRKGELDLVTAADLESEKLVVEAIAGAFPNDEVLAEEGSARSGDSGYRWIIDPLDGTTNFAHRLPQFCSSIALAFEGEVRCGVVFDPIKDEFFAAEKGKGATLNGRPIQVAGHQLLRDALAVTGFSYDRRERMEVLLERVRRILSHCQGMRRLGSAALDLAYLACGRFDIYLEDGLNAWDIAAGQLLVSEAGGLVSQLNGSELDLDCGGILAANPTLHPQALTRLTAPEGTHS